MRIQSKTITLLIVLSLISAATVTAEENWHQFKHDCRHSGNVQDRNVTTPIGLLGAVPLNDAAFTAPVVSDGQVYIIDGSGVVFCIDISTLEVLWKFDTGADKANCNNVSSPAVAGRYLHFGTMAGYYFVLDKNSGEVVKKILCVEPVFSSPVIANDRVYFATLGSKVYALEPDGKVCWIWDFVKESLDFDGDRWSGEEWCQHKGGRVTWRDQFCCSGNIVAYGKLLVVAAGSAICLEDKGGNASHIRCGCASSAEGSEGVCTIARDILKKSNIPLPSTRSYTVGLWKRLGGGTGAGKVGDLIVGLRSK